MSPLPRLYDHVSQRKSLKKVIFRKTAVFNILTTFGHFQDLSHEPIPKSVRPSVTSLEMIIDGRTDVRTLLIYRPQPFGLGHNQKQVFSEHEQAPTPPKSFSSISELSKTFRSKVLSRTNLEKPLFLAILANFTTFGRVFDRNGQKAHPRTKTFHLSL